MAYENDIEKKISNYISRYDELYKKYITSKIDERITIQSNIKLLLEEIKSYFAYDKERKELIERLRLSIEEKLFGNDILSKYMWINGEAMYSHSHIISLTIKGIPAQQLITLMNLNGVIVSAGSACSSGEEKPSRILKAIGLSDEDAKSTIRISFNEFTTDDDINKLVKSLEENILILIELNSEDKI